MGALADTPKKVSHAPFTRFEADRHAVALMRWNFRPLGGENSEAVALQAHGAKPRAYTYTVRVRGFQGREEALPESSP